MRIKAALVIMAIIFAFTTASYFLSLSFTKQNLTKAMEQEFSLTLDVADTVVATKISLLKSNTETVAERLLNANSVEKMPEIMNAQIKEFPEFISLTVYDREKVISHYGAQIYHNIFVSDTEDVQTVFNGERIISSPHYSNNKEDFVMHIFVPIDKDHILSATISGMLFSDLLSGYKLWETGNIYMIDAKGVFISNYRHFLVLEQHNFIEDAKTNAKLKSAGEFFQRMITSDSGSGRYYYNEKERLCVYKRVTDSVAGWIIAVSAPLDESPLKGLQNGLLLASMLFMVAGAIISIFVSRVAIKPFKTIRKQAAEIQAEHEHAKLLMDATPFACRLWSKDLKIFDCNEAAFRLFKMQDKQEYIDRYFELSPEFQPDGSRSIDKTYEILKKVFAEGRYVFEWMHQLLDGTPVPVEITLIRLKQRGDEVIAGYTRDLREYKQMMDEIERSAGELEIALKDAEDANQAKTSFLANMSHEMRTPLNAILGLSELTLESEGLPEDDYINLEKISNAGMALLSMVNDILDISKIEAGKFEITPFEYDMPSLINDAVTQSIMHKGEKPIDFFLNIDGNLPAQLFGDELRIKQVFNNLLTNAFKYTKEGTIEFGITCTRQDSEAVLLTAYVRDTGIGIRPENKENLFEDYVQMDARANRNIMGTGLGLPIAKRLLSLMDGSITVESEYGIGSLFQIEIPQGFVTEAVIGQKTADNLKNFNYFKRKRERDSKLTRISLPYARILIVDDVVTNLDVAKGLMKPYGMQIDCVTSGQQAIDIINSEAVHYNAIFMDHMMPGMDGIEATRRIREINTEYAKTIPIIALTANAIAGNEKMFLENGFQAFISKPIEIALLDAVIRQWVRNKEQEKQLAIKQMSENGYPFPDNRSGEERRAPSERRSGIDRRILKDFYNELDMEKGLERFNGNEEVYFKILRSFTLNTRSMLEQIKEVRQETLSDYSITVHGIKGSSRGIFAEKIGAKAEALEKAAKAGDFNFVIDNNPDFIETVEQFIALIDNFLDKIEAEKKPKPKKEKPDRETLAQLLAASKSFDMDGADAAIAELERYEYDHENGLVTWLRESVDEADFKRIIIKLSAYEAGGNNGKY
ncbi:MAG: ATP-binding protein [Spirochaetaceae bacterium]|nr:ATP-binding protein [Spirochaetaceae bacterium]